MFAAALLVAALIGLAAADTEADLRAQVTELKQENRKLKMNARRKLSQSGSSDEYDYEYYSDYEDTPDTGAVADGWSRFVDAMEDKKQSGEALTEDISLSRKSGPGGLSCSGDCSQPDFMVKRCSELVQADILEPEESTWLGSCTCKEMHQLSICSLDLYNEMEPIFENYGERVLSQLRKVISNDHFSGGSAALSTVADLAGAPQGTISRKTMHEALLKKASTTDLEQQRRNRKVLAKQRSFRFAKDAFIRNCRNYAAPALKACRTFLPLVAEIAQAKKDEKAALEKYTGVCHAKKPEYFFGHSKTIMKKLNKLQTRNNKLYKRQECGGAGKKRTRHNRHRGLLALAAENDDDDILLEVEETQGVSIIGRRKKKKSKNRKEKRQRVQKAKIKAYNAQILANDRAARKRRCDARMITLNKLDRSYRSRFGITMPHAEQKFLRNNDAPKETLCLARAESLGEMDKIPAFKHFVSNCNAMTAKECKCTVCSVKNLFEKKMSDLGVPVSGQLNTHNPLLVMAPDSWARDATCRALVDPQDGTCSDPAFLKACSLEIPSFVDLKELTGNVNADEIPVPEATVAFFAAGLPAPVFNFFSHRFMEASSDPVWYSASSWGAIEEKFEVTLEAARRRLAQMDNTGSLS